MGGRASGEHPRATPPPGGAFGCEALVAVTGRMKAVAVGGGEGRPVGLFFWLVIFLLFLRWCLIATSGSCVARGDSHRPFASPPTLSPPPPGREGAVFRLPSTRCSYRSRISTDWRVSVGVRATRPSNGTSASADAGGKVKVPRREHSGTLYRLYYPTGRRWMAPSLQKHTHPSATRTSLTVATLCRGPSMPPPLIEP